MYHVNCRFIDNPFDFIFESSNEDEFRVSRSNSFHKS